MTANIIMKWGANIFRSLFVEATKRDMKTPDEQAVILLAVLPDDCNTGYSDFKMLLLKKVNGQSVINLKDFITRIEANKEKYLTLEFERGIVTVLDTEQAPMTILHRLHFEIAGLADSKHIPVITSLITESKCPFRRKSYPPSVKSYCRFCSPSSC